MYAKIIIAILCFPVVVGIYLIFRSRFNGSGIRNNKDSIDELKNGTNEVAESSDRIKSGVNKAKQSAASIGERAESIEQHNRQAESGIDEALDILERAKDRNTD